MSDVVIATTALTRRYDALVAVDHLDLEVRQGVIFGLLGPNGAGKTTTIKMLTTLLPPTSGTAWVAGFEVAAHPRDVRRRIGYVPQMVSADGALTARENLVLSAKLYRIPRAERRARIDAALEFMGLAAAADALVRTYSGGMIRRLELAQAMLHQPAVLFLDEPTIGLDPLARRAVWERLEELQERQGTTILISHPRHGRGRCAVRRAGDHASRPRRIPRHAGGAEGPDRPGGLDGRRVRRNRRRDHRSRRGIP